MRSGARGGVRGGARGDGALSDPAVICARQTPVKPWEWPWKRRVKGRPTAVDSPGGDCYPDEPSRHAAEGIAFLAFSGGAAPAATLPDPLH